VASPVLEQVPVWWVLALGALMVVELMVGRMAVMGVVQVGMLVDSLVLPQEAGNFEVVGRLDLKLVESVWMVGP